MKSYLVKLLPTRAKMAKATTPPLENWRKLWLAYKYKNTQIHRYKHKHCKIILIWESDGRRCKGVPYKGDAVENDQKCLNHGLTAWVVIHPLVYRMYLQHMIMLCFYSAFWGVWGVVVVDLLLLLLCHKTGQFWPPPGFLGTILVRPSVPTGHPGCILPRSNRDPLISNHLEPLGTPMARNTWIMAF